MNNINVKILNVCMNLQNFDFFGLVCCGGAVSPARQAIVYNGQHFPLSPPPQPHNWQRQSGIQSHFHSAEWMSVFRGMHRWQRLYSSGNSPENSPNSPENHIHIKLCSGTEAFLWGSCVSVTGWDMTKICWRFFFLFFSFALFLTRLKFIWKVLNIFSKIKNR